MRPRREAFVFTIISYKRIRRFKKLVDYGVITYRSLGMPQTSNAARIAVLESAIKAFARKGYAGTSVQEILSATKLSKPTLYYYFGSKAGLFRAILDFAYSEIPH